MKLLCRFGWHQWTNWNEPHKAKKNIGLTMEMPVTIFAQTRRCAHCNKAQLCEIKASGANVL